MSVQSGFFNSITKGGVPDRTYDAEAFGKLFDGVITDGVFEHVGTCFDVHAVEGSMTVTVGKGRCWFNHTWLLNDSILTLNLDPAFDLLNRYDSIIIEVNHSVDTREATIKVLKGVGATDAVPPELTNTNYIHQYRIADVYIAADTSEISDANIDYYVGYDDVPYVTAPLEIVSSDAHWSKWKEELEEFVDAQSEEFNTWFTGIKDILDASTAGNLQNQIDANKALIAALTAVVDELVDHLTTTRGSNPKFIFGGVLTETEYNNLTLDERNSAIYFIKG